jgi:uncharacterized Zn-finger protein
MDFSRKVTLQVHVQSVHEKKRPHQCQFCGRNFTLKAFLKRHEAQHLKKSGTNLSSNSVVEDNDNINKIALAEEEIELKVD